MKQERHVADFCVVGGGLAGLCAALAAARHGARTVLMQDRPVLGGNASSEIRMHICGAHGANMRESGIVEEIRLENNHCNPSGNFSIWDSVLFGKARFQPNLTLLLNCSAQALEMDGTHIRAVTGWQGTSQTMQTVEASLFADCSGDSILAPLSGAEVRIGREAAEEFGEDIQPSKADGKTMGLTCLIQFRETNRPQRFMPPPWAYRYETDEDLRGRDHDLRGSNFWWIEVGGEHDSIHDTESLRDELLKISFGVIDHIKNRGDHGAENWAVEWVGFLPGKRESRRYVGDHILTQNDVRAAGPFDDIAAYGGWSMDDHHPSGFYYPGAPTQFHWAPSPYGIPYRCLYSRTIGNLFCAGRNISATHAALSSTRVMSTCAILGQAVGTAAAIAVREGTGPRGIYAQHLRELQRILMDDDCYLPGLQREIAPLCRAASLEATAGDPEPMRNGVDRPVGEDDNGWKVPCGEQATYTWEGSVEVEGVRLVFDSDLYANGLGMPHSYPLDMPELVPPETLVKAYRLEARDGAGQWRILHECEDNYQRLVRIPLPVQATAIRFTPLATWGAPQAHVQAFEPY